MLKFKALIYKTGINWCVDVPGKITSQLAVSRGYIKIRGKINDFDFSTTLIPVKASPYRLFVNGIMMKGAKTAVGKVAYFKIEQDRRKFDESYSFPAKLKNELQKHQLTKAFSGLTESRKKDILKYLSNIKTEDTLIKNINKVVAQLKEAKQVRIP